MADGIVVEWAPFKLAPGKTETELMEASGRLQREFIDRQPGFLRRELLRSESGGWVDLLYWRSMRDAQAAMEKVAGSPVCERYFSLMEGDPEAGAGVLHLERRTSYGAPVSGGA